MVVSKSLQNFPDITLHGQKVERVRKYNYLGAVINENNDSSEEIRIREEKARATFTKMKKVFCGRDLSLKLKIRLVE